MCCNTRICNSDTPLLTNFKLQQNESKTRQQQNERKTHQQQNESKTRHLYLFFLDIQTQEVQDSEFYLKHPQQGYVT